MEGWARQQAKFLVAVLRVAPLEALRRQKHTHSVTAGSHRRRCARRRQPPPPLSPGSFPRRGARRFAGPPACSGRRGRLATHRAAYHHPRPPAQSRQARKEDHTNVSCGCVGPNPPPHPPQVRYRSGRMHGVRRNYCFPLSCRKQMMLLTVAMVACFSRNCFLSVATST